MFHQQARGTREEERSMMESIAIRRATEQDMDTLMSLYDEFHRFHVQGVPDRLRAPDSSPPTESAALSKALSALLHREDAALFVAVVAEQVVGLVEVYMRQDEPHPLRVAYRF